MSPEATAVPEFPVNLAVKTIPTTGAVPVRLQIVAVAAVPPQDMLADAAVPPVSATHRV